MNDEVTKLKEELAKKEEKIAEQEKLLGDYWNTIQSQRISNRLKSAFGYFKIKSQYNKLSINGFSLPFESTDKPVINIKIAPQNWLDAPFWGDYYFARSLRNSLVRHGYIVKVQVQEEWYINSESNVINLVLRGPKKYKTNRRTLNVMWNISHPNEIELEEYKEYDHVFIASLIQVRKLQPVLKDRVSCLLQCTDSQVFYPSATKSNKILFIGNSHGFIRPIVKAALDEKLKIHIYGKDWEGLVPDSYIKGDFISNKELRKYYSKGSILLNDHWDDMRLNGFLSNRVFDVLACNGTIITDRVENIPDDINEYLHVWNGKSGHLKQLIHLLESDEVKLDSRRNVILNSNTFDQRCKQLINIFESIT